MTRSESPRPQEGLRWRVGVLCAGSPVAPAGPRARARTHLAIPGDEQLPVEGDVVVLKLQQRHQLQAQEQKRRKFGKRRVSASACVSLPLAAGRQQAPGERAARSEARRGPCVQHVLAVPGRRTVVTADPPRRVSLSDRMQAKRRACRTESPGRAGWRRRRGQREGGRCCAQAHLASCPGPRPSGKRLEKRCHWAADTATLATRSRKEGCLCGGAMEAGHLGPRGVGKGPREAGRAWGRQVGLPSLCQVRPPLCVSHAVD